MAVMKTKPPGTRKVHSKTKPAPHPYRKKGSYAEKINQTLFQIANTVNTAHDLNALYESIHHILSAVIDVTNFFIALYDKNSDTLAFPFHRDEKDTIEAYAGGVFYQASKSSSITVKVIKTGRHYFFQKHEILERYQNTKLYGTIPEQWLGVPLRVKDSVIGAMVVQSYIDPDLYRQKDADLLLAASDQVALAIERRRSEDALRESKERYQHLVDNIDDIIFSIDADFQFTYLSPAIESITGYGVNDFQGRFIRDYSDHRFPIARQFESIIHPEDRETVQAALADALRQLSHYAIEYRIMRKNGRMHWVYEKGIAYEDPQRGKAIEGIIQDIHQRKHAEEINRVLFSISNAVNTTVNLDDLYRSIHHSLSRIIDATNFFISLYDKATDSLHVPYEVDEADDLVLDMHHISSPGSNSHTAIVIKTGKPVLHTHEDFLKYLNERNLKPGMTLSKIWLGVPLKIQDEVVGAMVVHSHTNPDLYDQKDVDVLLSVSEQVALAIERKKAEEALQVEKARLEQLFSDSREAIAITDTSGKILRINQAFTDFFGFQLEEAWNFAIDDLLVPEEFRQQGLSYTAQLVQGISGSHEVIRRRKDGKRLNVIATGIPIFVNRKVESLYCIYRNITEQRRAETIQALLYDIAKAVHSTQNLDAFFEIIRQSLGKIVDTTNFYIALYDPEKAMINFAYYVDEKDLPVPVIPVAYSGSLTARVIRSKKPLFLGEKEVKVLFAETEDPPIGSLAKIWMGVPLLIREEIIGAVVLQSYRDPSCYSLDDVRLLESVSEQIAVAIDSKRTRDALEESEKRYRTVFEGTADAIFVHDMGGHFLDVNELACQRYGYTRAEFMHMTPLGITTHKEPQRIQERVAKIRETGQYISETMHIKKDGSLIPTELSSKIIEYLGKPAVLSVARDITERKKAEEEKKKLEEQLRQAQKMEAIGTLAGGIAHDFNNILSPIIGYTELGLYALPPDSSARRNMHEVLKAAERAKNLVKQILTFSRQSEKQFKPLKAGPIIREVAQLLQATLPASIQVTWHMGDEQGAIMADPTQIHQVLMNLTTNAYHAMKLKGGSLVMKLREVMISPPDRLIHPDLVPGPYLILTVSDTGQGIDPLIMGRIFDPYFTTKAPGEGTGMGLAVVHGIIKSYKGDIHISSEPGMGTTFDLYIPQIVSEAPLTIAETPKVVPGGTEHILLVDDEAQIVDILEQMLTQLGYQVTAKAGSIEALEAFRAQPDKFDLVITDQTMPKMSGAEMAQVMMRIRPDIPIILCTGFSEIMNESQAKGLGIREYVMKPIIKNEIAASIRRVLAS